MKLLNLMLSLTICSAFVTKLPIRGKNIASHKSIGKHFSNTVNDDAKDGIYVRDESDDISEVDEGAVQKLLCKRKEAKENQDFQKADSFTYELLSSYSVSVSDTKKSWCTGFTKGHFYTKSENSGENTSNLSEQEIDDLIAKRMCARNDRKFDVADEIMNDLTKSGIFVSDNSRKWGFLSMSTGHGYTKSDDSEPNMSNLSDQEIEDLLAQRGRARDDKIFKVADKILCELQNNLIFVEDKSREWRFSSKGHNYKKPTGYDPSALKLSEEEIDDLIARRLKARNDNNFDAADEIQTDLKTAGILLDDRSKKWIFTALDVATEINGAPTTGTSSKTTVASVPKVAQRWRKSTKQLITLGPASSNLEMIEKLFLAGADVFRLNFSHGSQEQKKELLDIIRSVEKKYAHPIGVLGDLQGPKLRVGEFSSKDGEILEKGQTFRFDLDEALGDNTRVQLPHPEIIQASEVGHTLMVDDGKVKLTVTGKGDKYLDCNVDVRGKISNRKGVNTPDSILSISPLTAKDRSDLEYMLGIGVDWVALSFVQKPEDIEEIHELIDAKVPAGDFKPCVMAKIEKPSCFEDDNLERIVGLCDGIMVARGDLGVECPPEDVPILQKTIIDECRKQGKPVVVATQMLESMIESPTPTRAEASDVATAIYDGADAIMLSAESAAGSYPEESVAMQQRIINRVESDAHYRNYLDSNTPLINDENPTDAIISAARHVAKTTHAKAVVCFSLRGSTVLSASKMRPPVPILALCPFKETARQLVLSWGVYPDLPTPGSYGYDDDEDDDLDYDKTTAGQATDDFDLVLRNACKAALRKGLVTDPDDLLVLTAGLPFGTPGAANVVRVVPAAGPSCWDGICRID